ncbi:MAG: hypothetical protein IJK02_08040 [Clostridia bacterium]|nr:hypothetical protein [Clostridia bacterium]MBR0510725.1 hypothetical protein [Clostridia bacterium]
MNIAALLFAIQLVLILFCLSGLVWEKRMIAFEERILRALKNKIAVRRYKRVIAARRRLNKQALYRPLRPAAKAQFNKVA